MYSIGFIINLYIYSILNDDRNPSIPNAEPLYLLFLSRPQPIRDIQQYVWLKGDYILSKLFRLSNQCYDQFSSVSVIQEEQSTSYSNNK